MTPDHLQAAREWLDKDTEFAWEPIELSSLAALLAARRQKETT